MRWAIAVVAMLAACQPAPGAASGGHAFCHPGHADCGVTTATLTEIRYPATVDTAVGYVWNFHEKWEYRRKRDGATVTTTERVTATRLP